MYIPTYEVINKKFIVCSYQHTINKYICIQEMMLGGKIMLVYSCMKLSSKLKIYIKNEQMTDGDIYKKGINT